MTNKDATDLWLKFVYDELNPRKSQNGWFKITGDRICAECPRHKNRSLYVWIQDGKHPFLKCFRASCTIRRYMTVEDFNDFGFDNKDAIRVLMTSSKIDTDAKEWNMKSKPVILQDKILNSMQLKYLEKRTGIRANLTDVMFYRIVPNLHQTIHDTLDEDDTELMSKFNSVNIPNDKKAITFATRDYRMFMYRTIYGNYKIKYALEKDYGYTLYKGLPNTVDTLVITEGIFDIINIYNKYYKKSKSLYIASLGAESILECICYWYRQHVETIKNIVIFADSDKMENFKLTYDKKFYNKLIHIIDNKIGLNNFDSIKLYYNTKSKDFGDISLEIDKKEVILYKREETNVIFEL